MNLFAIFQTILVYAIPILFAITVHEVAHGWVASKLGDQTARMLGRLTLNPIKHIDLVGTILVPAILVTLGGFLFGWAKPVPVNWRNLRKPKRDSALVAVAGPLTNLIMAFLWGLITKLAMLLGITAMIAMGEIGITINAVLLILNLIPVPPLDGSRVVSSLLPNRAAAFYERIEPFGFFILVLLLFSGFLTNLLNPPVLALRDFIARIFGL